MAAPGSSFTVPFDSFALATGAKTAVYLVADTQTGFVIPELSISCDGTKGLLLVELVLGTNAGAGTAGEEVTPVLLKPTVGGETLPKARTAAKIKYSAEPTVLTRVKQWQFPLPGGPFVLQAPLGREPGSVALAAATSGSRVGIRLSVTEGTPNARGYVEIEE